MFTAAWRRIDLMGTPSIGRFYVLYKSLPRALCNRLLATVPLPLTRDFASNIDYWETEYRDMAILGAWRAQRRAFLIL